MPTFKTLWDNYPDLDVMKKKCRNRQGRDDSPFDNYCAILMSECMIRSGIRLDRCPAVKCWSHTGSRHVIRAEELALWLAASPPDGVGRKEDIAPSDFQKQLNGRTGIVFFKDYWTRSNERFTSRSGDHIDLWKHSRITGGSMWYRSLIELLGLVSDLNKSRQVWFWEVN